MPIPQELHTTLSRPMELLEIRVCDLLHRVGRQRNGWLSKLPSLNRQGHLLRSPKAAERPEAAVSAEKLNCRSYIKGSTSGTAFRNI